MTIRGKFFDAEKKAVIVKKGRWYIGMVRGMPGVNTQGRSLAELRPNLKDAILLGLETRPPLKLDLRREFE